MMKKHRGRSGDQPLKNFPTPDGGFPLFVLLMAAGISVVLREGKDFALIPAIIVFNVVLGFVQEYRALVPRDVVILEEGRAVPANIWLIEVRG